MQRGTEEAILLLQNSRRSELKVVGRIDGGTKTIIDNTEEVHLASGTPRLLQPGDYVLVEVVHINCCLYAIHSLFQIMSATSQTLVGRPISITTLQQSMQ
uniref:Uncharacterized protein n=1 Tax=Plectus sambesii TaxID=2011161 RepID=A0A914XS10_9BILA